MLSEYHVRFVQLLASRGVDFLIIGGQAKFIVEGTPTRDLDLWADYVPENNALLREALFAWGREYPAHVWPGWEATFRLRPYGQMHFPVNDALYLNGLGEMVEIKAADGIDVLTSLRGMDFERCKERACTIEIGGSSVHYLSKADLDTAARLRS